MLGNAMTVLALGVAMAGAGEAGRDDAVALARKTLAGALAVPVERVEVQKAEDVDWPDASLGCPEKDRRYAQVITPGHRVVLKAGGRTYEVHTAGSRAVVCPPVEGGGTVGAPGAMLDAVAKLAAAARKDLAVRLSLPEAQVVVQFMRPTTWPDAGLGCPEPVRTYAPGPVRGFLIELEAQGKTYRYHSDETVARFCAAPPPEPPK
jgi:hypothetical protein